MRKFHVLPVTVFIALLFVSQQGYAQTGKVGIGTTTPQAHLHVNNPGGATQLTIGESAQSGGFTALNIATSAATNGYSSLQSVSKSGSTWGNLILNASGGNVGIGNVIPVAKLDIAGTLRIADGTQGAGKYLKSDASGFSSWQTLDGQDLVGTSIPGNLFCPAPIAPLAVGNSPYDIALSGNYGFVTGFNGSLKVVDISNPAALTVVGSVASLTAPSGIAVSGNYVYVVSGNGGGQVINILNPAAPAVVATLATTGDANGIAISGNYAYVINADNTLQVFNITNPAAPAVVGSANTGNEPTSIAISGTYAYVTTSNDKTLQVFNIANPSAPTLAGSVATANSAAKVVVAGNYAYVINNVGNTFQVIDITNPATPSVKGTVATDQFPLGLTIAGSYAYITCFFGNTLQVINISNPASPVVVGSASTGGRSFGIVVKGSNAFVANNTNNTVQSFNLACNINYAVTVNSSTGQTAPVPLPWTTTASNISNANPGNVGIGIATPLTKLDVTGTGGLRVSSANTGTGTSDWIAANIGGTTGNRVVAGLLDGVATIGAHTNELSAWANLAINPGGGFVGIGTTTPGATLDVKGDARFGSFLRIGTNVAEGYFQNAQDGAYRALQTGGTQGYFFQNYNGVKTAMYVGLNGTYAGKVGIGNTAPVATLDVTGNIKIADGTQGAGKVLTSDANGLASWASSATGPWTVSGNNIFKGNSGNVGIGTAVPKQLLTVQTSGSEPSSKWIVTGAPVFTGYGEGTPGNADFSVLMASASPNGRSVLGLKRSRGTLAAPEAVADADQLGSLLVSGYDGNAFQGAAAVDFFADGTPAAGSVPARISFVTGSNSSTRAERLKIGNTGDITMNTNQFFLQKSSGNVGIGTNGPTENLVVSEAAGATANTQNLLLVETVVNPFIASAQGIVIQKDDGQKRGFKLIQQGADDASSVFKIASFSGGADVDRFTIRRETGNVGIGTATPAATLDVKGDGRFGSFLRIGTDVAEGYFQNSQDGAYRALQTGGTQGYYFQDYNGANTAMYVGLNGTFAGKVGIGTATPDYKLTVVGTSKITGAVAIGTTNNDGSVVSLRVTSGAQINWKGGAAFGNTSANVIMGELAGVATIGGHNALLSAWGNLAINPGGGNVGIGTATPSEKLSVSGNICYTGSIGACSDFRYKKGITPLTGSLSKLLQMQGVNYYWKSKDFPDKQFNDQKQIGFIAQDVEKLYPELVITDADGYKSVDYSKVTPILTEAIKELKLENEQLKASMEQLKADTERRLKLLEEKLNK